MSNTIYSEPPKWFFDPLTTLKNNTHPDVVPRATSLAEKTDTGAKVQTLFRDKATVRMAVLHLIN